MRGQKSSSSPGVRRGFEGGQMPLYRRIPKLRGCHYKVLPLVQRITESHHRKCLVCAASFGPNDVKSVCISDWKLGNVCFCCSYMIPSSRTFDLVVLIYDTIFKDTIYKNRRSVEILLGPGSTTLENTREKFLDVKRLSLQVRESLEELQSKVDKSRLALMGVLIELEKERFDKKRMEEELDIVRRKVLCLQAQKEGSSVVDELRQELREYREIV